MKVVGFDSAQSNKLDPAAADHEKKQTVESILYSRGKTRNAQSPGEKRVLSTPKNPLSSIEQDSKRKFMERLLYGSDVSQRNYSPEGKANNIEHLIREVERRESKTNVRFNRDLPIKVSNFLQASAKNSPAKGRGITEFMRDQSTPQEASRNKSSSKVHTL